MLQTRFAKKNMWARVGGEDGEMLTRCAFALLVKYCGEELSLELALEEFDAGDVKAGEEDEEHAMDALDSSSRATFLLQWGKSSQMRRWLTEQKKELGNKYGEGPEYAV